MRCGMYSILCRNILWICNKQEQQCETVTLVILAIFTILYTSIVSYLNFMTTSIVDRYDTIGLHSMHEYNSQTI